ncbi:snRNA-activating protein complex subunit 1b [Echeneis naucrates]|uniref:Small nuclear RNA activating complex, polypeptide 1b n=1 Tax=Echeneis naucrates TaxID=173247 RepID=A0A665XA17_ECHNA|nr:snRNA-activating protein complex subunit 1 [Echeneis naucrates]
MSKLVRERRDSEPVRKALKSDFEMLLSRFKQTESVRFETFSNIWREMNFGHIFYGITVMHKKRKFSRLVLDMAYSFFLPPFSFHIRVGGLYLLYSLYRCQTALPIERIRLALKDWDDVKKFEKDAVNAKHLDVVYVFQKLMFLKAFHFTAMPIQLHFNRKRNVEKSLLCEEFIERPSRPQELINIELLEELSNIQEIYEKLKSSVPSLSGQMDSSVNLIHKDLVPKLRSTVVDFYKWQKMQDAEYRDEDEDEDEDSGEGTSSQQECSRRASIIASIKSRAYGQVAETSKARRHRQVELDLNTTAGPSIKTGYIRISKPSLKARTSQKILISGNTGKGTPTLINRLTSLDPTSDPEAKSKGLKEV